MRNTVLVVDDMEINREILTEILSEEYEVKLAENGRKALEMIQEMQGELAVILLDLMMPEVDGFAVLEVMQKTGWIEKIPVLIISGETSLKAEKRCFEYGISDFIRKPFDNILIKKRVKNIVSLFQYQRELEQKVEEQTMTLRKQYKLLQLQADKLKKSTAISLRFWVPWWSAVTLRAASISTGSRDIPGFWRSVWRRIIRSMD